MFAVGGEQVVGEVLDDRGELADQGIPNQLVGVSRELKNPKRLVRLQMRDQRTGALTIEFLLGNWDFIEGGTVQVQSSFAYWVKDTSPASQIGLISLFVEMMKRRAEAESRIQRPESSIVLPGLGMKRG